MGLPCVKSGRFARIDGAVAPLNATSGRFARLDTEIGTLTVMNGRLSQSEYVVRPLDAIDGCLSQWASAISNPGKAGCAMMRADTAGVSARKHPSGSHRETGGAFPPQTFRRHGGTVRPTLRRSEANGPFRVQRTFLSGNPRGATAKPFRQQQAEPSGGRRAEPGRTGAPRGPIAALGLPPDQLFTNSRCGGVGYNYEQYA